MVVCGDDCVGVPVLFEGEFRWLHAPSIHPGTRIYTQHTIYALTLRTRHNILRRRLDHDQREGHCAQQQRC